jgi:pre-rRNA-processing protein TSR4
VALASTRITESKWSDAPSYPPLYLSTVSEYIPARPAPTPSEAVKTEVTADGSADVWNEVYENSMNLDQVFERFSKRVQYEGEQCVR